MKFTKYFGYNIRDNPVPLGVTGNRTFGFISRGGYVIGLGEDNNYYIVRSLSQYYIYSDQTFCERVIKDKTYLKFKINPFSKSTEEWEEYSKNLQPELFDVDSNKAIA